MESQKIKKYGIPFKGSKNKIAEWVYSHFPKAENFYDLFAGGCAITHTALLHDDFKRYFANDIDFSGITLFMESIHGKFRDETRWISREDFFSLKDKDPYIKYAWSFGNNGRSYLYSKEIEPWKKALHYARVYHDFSLLEEFGIKTKDASRIAVTRHSEAWKKKYIVWYCKNILQSDKDVLKIAENLKERIEHNSELLRNYLIEGLKVSKHTPSEVDRFLGTNGMAGHYFGTSQWEFPTREVYIKLQGFLYLPQSYEEVYGLQELYDCLQSLESLQSLQSLESLQSLQSLQSLESLERLSVSHKSYDEVSILPNSVLYCDIPYVGTNAYTEDEEEGFNHEAFYKWALRQKELVIISEYKMPDDFICIDAIEKTVTLCSGSDKTALEKLFIPKTQVELYQKMLRKR